MKRNFTERQTEEETLSFIWFSVLLSCGEVVKHYSLDLCLEKNSSLPIICGAEIHVGLGPQKKTSIRSVPTLMGEGINTPMWLVVL